MGFALRDWIPDRLEVTDECELERFPFRSLSWWLGWYLAWITLGVSIASWLRTTIGTFGERWSSVESARPTCITHATRDSQNVEGSLGGKTTNARVISPTHVTKTEALRAIPPQQRRS